MESEKGKETVGHVRPEAEEEESKLLEEANTRLPSSSSSASSSSSSSPRGSFEHDVMENSHPNDDSITKSKSEGDLSQGHNRPPQAPERSVSSNASPQTTSPPVQKMEQSSNYDPNRIPASIFASKPANASEWSVASNDSLFSIHVGNNSFTKDQFKSGEFLRLVDQSSSLYVPEAKSNELCGLPPLMEVPPHEESSSVKSSNISTLEKEEEAMKGSSTPRPSHENTASFAFPV